MNTHKNEQTMSSNDIVAIPNIITVIGVGSGGHKAVNYIYQTDVAKTSVMLYNTDTKNEYRLDGIKKVLSGINTKMLFIISCMDDVTEVDTVPIIAKLAKEMGILTIAMVIIPYASKDILRIEQALGRIDMISKCVDSLMVFKSKVVKGLGLYNVYSRLIVTIKGIEGIIAQPGYINVDFADVKTVLTDGGVVLMGESHALGEDRAINAVTEALESIGLNDILVAENILLNITSGTNEITMDEMSQISSHIIHKMRYNGTIIWGVMTDLNLGEKLSVIIIATGFSTDMLGLYNICISNKLN